MNLVAFFMAAVAGWLLACGVFRGVAWANGHALRDDGHALTLLDGEPEAAPARIRAGPTAR